MWFTASWSSSSRWRIGKKLPTALTVSWTSCSLRSTSSFFRLHMHLQFQKLLTVSWTSCSLRFTSPIICLHMRLQFQLLILESYSWLQLHSDTSEHLTPLY